jgi:hypothetical protein
VSGSVEVLCTLDAHFFKPEVLAFCTARQIHVVNDADLLKILRQA